jgi:hypothetical protein
VPGCLREKGAVDVHDTDGIHLSEVGGAGWFHIPYPTMLPRGIKDLLVAGRCISADYTAQGCTWSQASSMLTGQAAGTAAVIAIRQGVERRGIDIAELQRVLASQNQLI